jgi:putative endonuclease
MRFFVYLLECADETLYCGFTNDVDKRVSEHNDGKYGAKYTKGRRPVKLVYSEMFSNRSDAQKREYEIKKMSRRQKVNLINAVES